MKKNQNNKGGSRATSQNGVGIAQKRSNVNKGANIRGSNQLTVISHRELVLDTTADTTFTPVQVACNPGVASSFPWLNKVAAAFEQYRFRKLRYSYVPQCPTTSDGSAGLYFDYDPTDGSTTSVSDFSSMHGSIITKIWSDEELVVIQQPTPKFIRSGTVSGESLKLYDYGTFNHFMLSSVATPKGYVFVEYEVELIKPQVDLSAQASAGLLGVLQWNSLSGSTTNADPNYSAGVSLASTPGSITLEDGWYRVTVSAKLNTTPTGLTVLGKTAIMWQYSTTGASATAEMITEFTAGDYNALSVTGANFVANTAGSIAITI